MRFSEEISMYEEFATFLAQLAPEKILAYHPSEKQQNRLSLLLSQKQRVALSESEEAELLHFFTIERILRFAKTHALSLLVHEPVYS